MGYEIKKVELELTDDGKVNATVTTKEGRPFSYDIPLEGQRIQEAGETIKRWLSDAAKKITSSGNRL
jgi:hypothetical protein